MQQSRNERYPNDAQILLRSGIQSAAAPREATASGSTWAAANSGSELGGAGVGGLLARPDDHRRSGAGDRRAEGTLRRCVAELGEERRARGAVGLVQAVGERGREEVGVAGRERGAEERGAAGGEGGVRVRDGVGQRCAGGGRLDLGIRDDSDRGGRHIVRDPSNATGAMQGWPR